ncbi:hypothetical protein J3L18_02265 [Mucilaginibacter gossypii]|uniref:hypothetical protein n=1 Tax=Mucilaginibacter gossypii TaxID=551996 RepID=UPI000DCD9333|nr:MULTISPECIES: hypothetical protein [Mucilaginibacter]QTE40343.2 hypothetical protein J3L18_02265 [Mucilaginibacter gossypii]RAV48013.1 hypothetical protein DIU36_28985 [Mucilaginibacter rubeus]
MKRSLLPVLAGLGLCLAQISAHAQDYKEHISKQFTLQGAASGTTLAIYNIWGSITVQGYSGNQVSIEVDETIRGKSAGDVETGKKEVKLGFDQKADSIIAYTAEPYDTRPRRNWNREDRHHIDYTVKLEYTVKVPYGINLCVSTVNDGNIEVKDVYGALKVNNVNGGITIANAKGTTSAHTINGPLNVTYLSVPPDASSYYTLNGKLEVTYPANLAADLEFKSMNGQFYTDFPDAEILPTRVSKTESKSGSSTTYKLSKNNGVRIGAGGKLFKFETLNGNIYIKKQQ